MFVQSLFSASVCALILPDLLCILYVQVVSTFVFYRDCNSCNFIPFTNREMEIYFRYCERYIECFLYFVYFCISFFFIDLIKIRFNLTSYPERKIRNLDPNSLNAR